MEWQRDEITVSDDPGKLDIEFILAGLRDSYWASERSRDITEQSIAASLCLGAYRAGQQIGFTRVVTDRATFSWICDVFVAPEHRGRGVGKFMMQCVIEHPDLKTTSMWLATRDAHGLYERFGFVRQEMLRRPRPS